MSRWLQMSETPIDFELIRNEFISKYRSYLAQRDFSAILVTRIENVASLTRFRAPFGRSHYVMRYAVLLSSSQMTFFVRDGDYERASRRMPWLEDVRECPNYLTDAIEIFREAFADHGIGHGVVGVDLLPLGAYRELRSAMPDIEFEDIDFEILKLRAVKSAEEIKVIREVCEIVERAMEVGQDLIRPGMRECEIVGKVTDILAAENVEGPSLPPILNSSDHLGTLHRHTSDRQLREGDITRLDITAVWNNYIADFGRPNVAGNPSSFHRRVAQVELEAHRSCIDAIRPGVRASDIDRIARRVIEDGGFGEYAHRHFTGHGVGIGHQELPMIGEGLSRSAPGRDMVLEPGMVIAIEPGIKFHDQPELGGVWYEDMVLVTETGHEYLTRTSYSERLLGFQAAPSGPWSEPRRPAAEAPAAAVVETLLPVTV